MTTSFSILMILISVRVTDKGLPMVQPSACFENWWLNWKEHSVVNYNNERLKISLLHIGGTVSLYKFGEWYVQ